jgi:hypothetical protein
MGGLRDVFRTSDGALVMTTGGSTALLASPAPIGVQREENPVFRFDPGGGKPLATVGVFPGMEWARTEQGIGPPPFFQRTSFALRDTTLIVGTSESMSLDVRSLDGALLEIVRVRDVDLTVTDADVQEYRDLMFSMAPDDDAVRRQVTERLEAVPIPEKKAAYSELMVDPDGNLWVAALPIGTLTATRWSVFSPEGRLMGDVAMPDRKAFQFLALDSTSLLGAWMDDLDVHHVGVFAIRK